MGTSPHTSLGLRSLFPETSDVTGSPVLSAKHGFLHGSDKLPRDLISFLVLCN